jgi:hypothetical protein
MKIASHPTRSKIERKLPKNKRGRLPDFPTGKTFMYQLENFLFIFQYPAGEKSEKAKSFVSGLKIKENY